ncbi:MAG TPA: peptide ABC transporter substrate-binding protein [Stellaceae bacterium]|nr:peptide ABC transporter substrate-binding protein [Stellaceae bacterium]
MPTLRAIPHLTPTLSAPGGGEGGQWHRLCRLALLPVLCLLLAAPAAAEQILHRGHHDEPESLDPHKSDGAQEMSIEDDLFEGLTRLDSHGKVVPGVASAWEMSPDGLAWTFHLRPGLLWSDGSPLTAEDFVWSMRRAVDPATASPVAEVLYPIAGAKALNEGTVKDPATLGVAAPDPATVVIRLERPNTLVPSIMALTETLPVPRRAIEAHGESWARPGHMISNGAFILDAWRPQLDVTLKRNPHYWDAASVALDGVRWQTVEDEQTSLRLYRSGELDIAWISPRDVPRLRTEMPAELHTDTTLRCDFLAVNTRLPPFDDLRVRRALSMIIDRDTLAAKVNAHGQKPAVSLVPPGIEGYAQPLPDWAAKPMPERIAEAEELLAEAGFGPQNRLHVDLSYPTSETDRLTMLAVAAMWRAAGIDADPDNQEMQVFNAALRDHQEQIAFTDWIADYADPSTFLSLLDSRSVQENTPDYRNPEYDALLDKAAGILDRAARMAVLQEAEAIVNRDAPIIPIAFETRPLLVSPRVRGYVGNPLESNLSRDLSLAQ